MKNLIFVAWLLLYPLCDIVYDAIRCQLCEKTSYQRSLTRYRRLYLPRFLPLHRLPALEERKPVTPEAPIPRFR